MLWVNLIMDTFAALALATEPPGDDILDRAPYPKDSPIVTDIMWRNVFGHAFYQAIVIVVVIFAAPGLFVESYGRHCSRRADDGTCEFLNPFYAQDLYLSSNSAIEWNTRYTGS